MSKKERSRRTAEHRGGHRRKKRRFLDEIDGISSVSGGSFTADYYRLFGDRIFDDFETKFLKMNIQGALIVRTFLNPINWFKLSSDSFGRTDLQAEYL